MPQAISLRVQGPLSQRMRRTGAARGQLTLAGAGADAAPLAVAVPAAFFGPGGAAEATVRAGQRSGDGGRQAVKPRSRSIADTAALMRPQSHRGVRVKLAGAAAEASTQLPKLIERRRTGYRLTSECLSPSMSAGQGIFRLRSTRGIFLLPVSQWSRAQPW